jgi:hypothetical protein
MAGHGMYGLHANMTNVDVNMTYPSYFSTILNDATYTCNTPPSPPLPPAPPTIHNDAFPTPYELNGNMRNCTRILTMSRMKF